METWDVKITGKDEKSVIKQLEALLNLFKASAEYKQPLHFVEMSNGNTKLKCERKDK